MDGHNYRVRKIDTSGIISTIAGNGTSGFSGDGGPATLAQITQTYGIINDNFGNIYITDGTSNRIRKINALGIITTIAGTGIAGYSGDGGQASNANLNQPTGITIDNFGNIYFIDGISIYVRKINTLGVITKYAGNGGATFWGDGGPATAASFQNAWGLCADGFGNVFIADQMNNVIRKINPSGIINTVAGYYDAVGGYTGDGGMATNALLDGPYNITMHGNNLYITDAYPRIRKVSLSYIFSDSFIVYINNDCGVMDFTILANHYQTGQHIKTYFGNGQFLDTLTYSDMGIGAFSFYKSYYIAGNYTIKHVLYNGLLAVDSIAYTRTITPCQYIPLNLFIDANANCIKDSTENLMNLPSSIEVDSNGITIDTINATSGLYYPAYGNPLDVYKFRILTNPAGAVLTCPVSGIISDTLFYSPINTKYFGFQCTSSTGFDLSEHIGTHTGRHQQTLNISINNSYCTPEPSTLALTFSPQYVFNSSIPAPTSVVGNVATWNLGDMSIITPTKNIDVTLEVPGVYLTSGDTVMTYCVVTPITGDTDTTNNVIIRTDTVKSSYDPNEISVSPSGCIPVEVVTPLQYTIQFENTGNDTAHNIYVMDTLSDNLDPHSLRLVAASNNMITTKLNYGGGHTIYKFEFPSINLLDSSHHNQCDAMLIYKINTRAGLPAGTTIYNQAGIYFDDNPVVMTNQAANVTGCALNINRPQAAIQPSIFPNPATDILTIKAGSSSYTSYTISSIMGQEIIQATLTTPDTKVNIKQLPAGVYYVTFLGEGGRVVKKFVKM